MPFHFQGNSLGNLTCASIYCCKGMLLQHGYQCLTLLAQIFGCCGLRAVVLLEIVQYHGEILLSLFLPSGEIKREQSTSKWKMARNNIQL